MFYLFLRRLNRVKCYIFSLGMYLFFIIYEGLFLFFSIKLVVGVRSELFFIIWILGCGFIY